MTALEESVLFINDKTLLALIAEEGATYDEDLTSEINLIDEKGASHE